MGIICKWELSLNKSKTLLTLNMNINLETKHFLIEMSFFIRERKSNAVIVGPKLEVDHLKK